MHGREWKGNQETVIPGKNQRIVALGIVTIAWFGMAYAIESLSETPAKSHCEEQLCFLTHDAKTEYEMKYDCNFKDCHLANGEDIFRWAIGKKETGGPPYRYEEPDENPCSRDNDYCTATTGSPASAGRDRFYAASYGTHQITLTMLFAWLNPKGKTRFDPPPECLRTWFLNDKELMNAMEEAEKRRAFGYGLVSGRKVPAAAVDEHGRITYPAVSADIKRQALGLKILINGNADSEAEWQEMWERMAAWERLRQIIEAKWKEMVGDKMKAWGTDTKGKIISADGLGLAPTSEYLSLLKRLKMQNNGLIKIGIKPYVTGLHGKTPIWAEAANTFGNYALFAGVPTTLYTRLMDFFATTDCHISAVKQMFQLPKYGYDEKHANPNDAETERWVRKAAQAWNGSSGYADMVWPIYKRYYDQHHKKTEVCN